MKKKRQYIFPDCVQSDDIIRIRKWLNLSQSEFSKLVCVSTKTVSAWEQSDRKITGPIIPLIMILRNHVNYPEKYSLPEMKTPLRLKYMYGNLCCTLIDVSEKDQLVYIKNYVSNPIFRAFGTIEEPDWEQYQEFLESRCFPRTRDKMKLMLEHLGLPFYEPLLIIEKTQGRMEEDAFWIDMERK